MQTFNKRICGIMLGASLAVSSLTPAFADDSEIYVGAVSTVKPNILLILDTSFSMDTKDAVDDHPLFDNTAALSTYTHVTTSGCDDTKIFFTSGANAAVPACDSPNYISATSNQFCDKLTTAMAGASGRWTGKSGQFNATTKTWEDLLPNGTSGKVECMADRGIHGSAAGVFYARNGNATPWTGTIGSEINWAQRLTYTFYSGRYVKWNANWPYPAPPLTPTTYSMSRIDALKSAVNDMVSSIDDVNIGFMRFNSHNGSAPNGSDAEYQGGYVVKAIEDVTSSRNAIISKVDSIDTNSATPLTEMLYEAGQYWAGLTPKWGKGAADPAALNGSGDYQSPITESCQRNFNIILTDGRPTWDNQADQYIEGATGLYGGTCTGQPGEPASGPATGSPPDSKNAGRCLDEMSSYLANKNTDLSSTVTGKQQVKTFTVGIGQDSTFDFLKEVATDGGGQFYLASNVDTMSKALMSITTNISNISSTFATASIGVNSFNRAKTRDDLYFAVFNSDDHLKWDGNLKKYKLAATPDPDGTGPLQPKLIIVGTDTTTDAVDSTTGFFKDGTQSFWSTAPDGKTVTLGGAANLIPDPASRKVYTHIGSNPAGSFATLIPIDDPAVDNTQLDTLVGTPTRADVLAFALGGTPKRMGDPLHSQPSVVTYSGTATSPVDVVYMATNDGYLHAVDAATGVEKWSFVPQELLPRLKQLVIDPAATTRTYGIDGDIRIVKLDFNGDGDVDTADGDLVWLFVGMRRGGRYYYGLDVTNPNSPKLMWKDGPGVLKDIGETWSPPTIGRVAVSGKTQNNQKLVLIFGGGYDGSQENYTQVADAMGNNLWMVDAKTGALLWSAGDTTTPTEPHDLVYAPMTNSIPGRISVIDTNGDGYEDRMYAADTGGRIFRFDIFSGNPVSTLVTASVLAKLGTGSAAGGNDATTPNRDTRRFYNAPDVALIQRRGADPYYNLAIGSGYRGHPLYKPNLDRFYSLRDKQPYAKFTTNGALTPITELSTGLVDITPDPINAIVGVGADGWKFVFDPTGTSTTATGEKVLNEATTVNGVLLFSTYTPQTASATDPCRPTSINKVYAMRADNGHPALDLNGDGVFTNADLFEQVVHEGILGGVNVGVLRGTLADALGGSAGGGAATVCLAGMHILGKCVNVSDSVRTYWRKNAD